jgi:hypothetical protein
MIANERVPDDMEMPPSALRTTRMSPRKLRSRPELASIANMCFVMSLACPYLLARDLLALSLTSTAVRLRLRNGGARTLKIDINSRDNVEPQKLLAMLSKAFPHAKEVILSGRREECFGGLKGCAHLQVTRLSITLSDLKGQSVESQLDGRALAAAIAGFPLLERLEVRNLGPFAPVAFQQMCSCPKLQMIRFTRCPTLMDVCLNHIISSSANLREVSLEECPSLQAPSVVSESLVRLRLAHCATLRTVELKECPSLMILDVSYTTALRTIPSLEHAPNIRYVSLAGATGLQALQLDRLPSTLSSLSLSACVNLKSIFLGHCVGLVFLTLDFCSSLESLVMKQAHHLQELDLSLLRRLKLVQIEEGLSLRRLRLYACDSLKHENIFVTNMCRRYLS